MYNKLGAFNIKKLVSDGVLNIAEDNKGKICPVKMELNLDGDQYYGQVNTHDEPHGIGRFISASGNIHEGEFINGVGTGFGRSISKMAETYVGYWREDNQCGYGIQVAKSGDIIEEGLFEESELKPEGDVTYDKKL